MAEAPKQQQLPVRVQAPAPNGTDQPTALLVLMPGAMLSPKDYDALFSAVKAQKEAGVQMWLSAPQIDWPYMMKLGPQAQEKWEEYGAELVQQAVQAAQSEGFPLQGKPEARMDNVFVAMHSVSTCFYPGAPMKHCAGAVILAGAVDGTYGPIVDAAAAPRPLMHVLAAQDGQTRLPRAAWTAARLAPLAAQFGARHLATVRPFAIIPGMNHAQFSNGVVNAARGDLPSDVPLETQAEAVAGLLAAFVAANHPAASQESSHHAAERLMQATAASFELLSPYCEASGRGSPAALLSAGAAAGSDPAGADLASYAMGAERLPNSSPERNSFGHPGELAAAERFARAAQRRMLAAGLPAGADVAAVRVAVTVHVLLDTFIYSQPTVFQVEGPEGPQWVVQCHCHPKWEYYAPGMEATTKPMSPHYLLKLKKGGLVALAMGLEGGSDDVATAADINADSFEQALATSPPVFLDTYRQHGKQLSFAPDKDVSSEVKTPVDWMPMPFTFEPVGDGGLVLCAPCLSTPVAKLPHYDRGPGRFTGECKPSGLDWAAAFVGSEALASTLSSHLPAKP
jgi:hypothetical protein